MLSWNWMSVREVSSEMFFQQSVVQSPSLTLPHFIGSQAFISYIDPSHFIELSLPFPKSKIHFRETVELLDLDKIDKTARGFRSVVAMRTKPSTLKQSFFSVCLLYKSTRLCNLVLFLEIRTWPYFQRCGSCFVAVWIYLLSLEIPMYTTAGWDIEYGYSWLVSIPTVDLHMFVDFRYEFSSTFDIRVKTM